MAVRTILILALAFMVVLPAHGQDPCDIEAIRQRVQSDLNQARSLDDFRALHEKLYQQISQCSTATTPGASRDYPIPFGEWYQLTKGKIRVTGISFYNDATPAPGNRFIAVALEYLCESTDPSISCLGSEAAPQAVYVDQQGHVYNPAPIYFNIINGMNNEGYAGVTLYGNIYFEAPADMPANLMRISQQGQFVFLALG